MDDVAFSVGVFFILLIANTAAVILGKIDRKRNEETLGWYYDDENLLKHIEEVAKMLKEGTRKDDGNET